MILYTTLPAEAVLEGYDTFKPEYIEMEHRGATLVIEMISPLEGRLVRLISPRVEDYLLPENQPGSTISLNPSATVGTERV